MPLGKDGKRPAGRTWQEGRSRAFLQRALTAGGVAVWDWDILTNEVVFSTNWESLCGLAPGTFDGTYDGFIEIIHPRDRDHVRAWIASAVEGAGAGGTRFRVVTGQGGARWLSVKGMVFRDAAGKPAHMLGATQDVTERVESEQRVVRHRATLLDLTGDDAASDGDLDVALERLVESVARTLGTSRVGIWLFTEDRSSLECVELYDRDSDSHARGLRLGASDFPHYFDVIGRERIISAYDARTDPRTEELGGDYLEPNGIRSLLSAPIRRGGRSIGVVCHEQVGDVRRWTADEQTFAASVGDLVAMDMERAERQAAERDVSRLRSLLIASVENSPAGILIADAPDGRIRLANRAALGITGSGGRPLTEIPEELHPRNWRCFGPDGRQYAADEMPLARAIFKGRPTRNMDIVIRQPDGQERWVLGNAAPVRNPDGEIIGGIVVFPDVTERRRMEQALAEGEERFRSLVSNAPVAVYRCMLDDAGTTRFVSDFVEVITGYPPSDFIDNKVRSRASLIHRDDRAMVERAIHSGVREREPYSVEYRIVHRDGATRWVHERGRAAYGDDGQARWVDGVMADVTELNDARQTLQSTLAQLQAFLDFSPHEIIIRGLDGRYLFFNKEAERLYGIDVKDVVGRTAQEVFPGDLGREFGERFAAVVRTGEALTVEEHIPTATGTVDQLCVRFPIRDANGATTAVGSIATDISDLKRTARALSDREARLRLITEQAPAILWTTDRDLRFTSSVGAALSHLDLEANEVVGQTLYEFFGEGGGPGLPPVEAHLKALDGDSARYDFAWSGHVYECYVEPLLDTDGDVVGCVGVALDITERLRTEQMVVNVSKGVSAETGEDFFRSLVEHLATALMADFAFIGELHPEREGYIRSIAAFGDGKPMERFEYPLDGTPCAHVLGKDMCSFAEGVCDRFPEDTLLAEMGIEAYVGSPLSHSDGRPLGIIVVLYRRFLDEVKVAESLLRIFVARASAELERQHSQRVLEQSEERYRAFLANSTEGIWRFDLEPPVPTDLPVETQVERVVKHAVLGECNPALARMLGYSSAETILGARLANIRIEGGMEEHIRVFVESGYRWREREFSAVNPGGERMWMSTSASGLVENGMLVRVWGTQREITERVQHLAELEHRATHDSLTGLPNRHWLHGRVAELLASAGGGHRVALLLMDLDRFKEINDTLGHHTGDTMLKELAKRLQSAADSSRGTVARLGGDEFAVLIPAVEDDAGPRRMATLVHEAVRRPFDLDGMKLELGASVGIAIAPDDGGDASSLLRCADVAMYRAKREGLDYERYRAELDDHSPLRLTLMTELGAAIREDQLYLEYQPKVSLAGERVVGYEALVRWHHPVHGHIPPSDFIPLAEMGDWIRPLTLWVVDGAVAQWRAWHDAGLTTSIAVNLSARNLVDESCPAEIAQILERHRMPPEHLELEITESALIADPDRAADVLRRIGDMGVSLSVDDFGTGYSSLVYLKSLPIDALKIDLSFVSQMTSSEQDAIIVSSTINLAHNLGLVVVAEGVEDRRTLDALVRNGCDMAQGYFLGGPVPAARVDGRLPGAD